MEQLIDIGQFYTQIREKEKKYEAVIKYFQDTLRSSEIVVFTDKANRPRYTELQEILATLKKEYKGIVLNDMPDNDGILEFLSIVTKGSKPPHMFFQEQYFASDKELLNKYEYGGMERLFGREPIIVA